MGSKRFVEANTNSKTAILAVLFFVGLYLWRLGTWVMNGPADTQHWTQLIVLGLLVAVLSWFLLHLRLEVKIGKKSLKVNMNDFVHPRLTLKWNAIARVEAFEIPEAQLWSGMNISFDHNVTQYNLGDNRGIKLVTKDEKVYLIYSDQLYNHIDLIKQRLAKQN